MEYPNLFGLCTACSDTMDDALAKCLQAYRACMIETADQLVDAYWPQAHTFDQRMTAAILTGTYAVHKGDLKDWKRAEAVLADEPCKNDEETAIREMLFALFRLGIYDDACTPEWLRMGRIERLPAFLYAFGGYTYLKYLCVCFRDEALLTVIEPLIAYAARDGAKYMELSMRLIAASSYHNAARDEEAADHLDKALQITVETGFWVTVAEHLPSMESFFTKHCASPEPNQMDTVYKVAKKLYSGYAQLRNVLLSRNVTTRLSAREMEAARYACRGMTNAQLARRMGLKVGSVSAILHSVYSKLDVPGRNELLNHIL